jgi:hypothetical protein
LVEENTVEVEIYLEGFWLDDGKDRIPKGLPLSPKILKGLGCEHEDGNLPVKFAKRLVFPSSKTYNYQQQVDWLEFLHSSFQREAL